MSPDRSACPLSRFERAENAPQHTRAHPLLKPAVARLIGGMPVREIGPWGAGPEDPQDAVEHRTILPPWAPPAVCAARQLGQEGPNQNPLVVGEVTGMRSSRKGHPGQNGPRYLAIGSDRKIGRQIGVKPSEKPGTFTGERL
jgi:hypothetical protein